MKIKKNRMERNLKKNEKRYSSEPEVMLIWCWSKFKSIQEAMNFLVYTAGRHSKLGG